MEYHGVPLPGAQEVSHVIVPDTAGKAVRTTNNMWSGIQKETNEFVLMWVKTWVMPLGVK
jgi:hypothetical protein